MSPISLGILAAAGAGVAGDFDLLETTELTSSTSSVTFTGLNSTYGSDYTHLQIRAVVKSTRAGAGEGSAGVKVNGSSSGNYSHRFRTDGNNTSSDSYSLNPMFYSSIARGDTANLYSPQIINIYDAFNPNKMPILHSLCTILDTQDDVVAVYSGFLNSVGLVDSLEFLDIATGDPWAAGTRFSLYGIKAA